MLLKHLKLFNFKNYSECAVDFHERINVIVGPNGSGKTTLLDAMHYLSMTKSAFSTPDSASILKGEDFFSIKGVFELENGELEAFCNLKKGQKKSLKVNGSEYDRLSDHIGLLPLVMIAPDDIDLIREGSEFRRRFIDVILSQLSREYLNLLMQYIRYLKQRNALLKNYGHNLSTRSDIFEPYDVKLVQLSKEICSRRAKFINDYTRHFVNYYRVVSDGNEIASIEYNSQVREESYERDFLAGRQRDIDTQRTNMGIHKDDYGFEIADMPVKKYASQGQKKSFTVALKLAKYQILKEHLNKEPFMLLDDIFDKLDDKRIDALLSLVASGNFGQLFITDAREKRTKQVLSKLGSDMRFIYVDGGVVTRVE